IARPLFQRSLPLAASIAYSTAGAERVPADAANRTPLTTNGGSGLVIAREVHAGSSASWPFCSTTRNVWIARAVATAIQRVSSASPQPPSAPPDSETGAPNHPPPTPPPPPHAPSHTPPTPP